jgi:hypothetical protein
MSVDEVIVAMGVTANAAYRSKNNVEKKLCNNVPGGFEFMLIPNIVYLLRYYSLGSNYRTSNFFSSNIRPSNKARSVETVCTVSRETNVLSANDSVKTTPEKEKHRNKEEQLPQI